LTVFNSKHVVSFVSAYCKSLPDISEFEIWRVIVKHVVADRQVLSRLKVKTPITLPAWNDAADSCDNVADTCHDIADISQVASHHCHC